MRGWLIAGIAVATTGLVGCSTSPISYVALSPQPQADVFTCVNREFNELGYTVSQANKEAGFIAGDRQTSGMGTALLTGKQYHDVLSVTIYDDGKGGQKVRATAGQSTENAISFGAASKTGGKPSDSGIRDAKALLKACTTGGVTQQASATAWIGEALAS